MKKYLAIVFLILSANVYADTWLWGSVGTQQNSNNTSSDTMSVKLITDLPKKGMVFDVLVDNNRNTTSRNNTLHYEIGVAQKFPINDYLIPHIRLNTGMLEMTGAASKTYVGVEPGFVAKLPNSAFYTKVDYGIYTGINNSVLDVTLAKVGVGYMFTKNDSVMIRRDWMRGDMSFDAWGIFYGHSF
jgi:hypothetical protein